MYKILDTYCKAGGAGMGYHKAGFKVVGVDIEEQANYPFEFHKGDAIEFIKKHGHEFDAIHASPPCQEYSCSTAMFRQKGKTYPDLIEITRNEIEKIGVPGIIENVSNSPIRPDIILYGHMFGLKVLRKRKFEMIKWFMLQPGVPQKKGSVKEGDYVSIFGKGAYKKSKGDAYPKFKKETVNETWRFAMGIDWMKVDKELAEAIPPAYTELIGKRLIEFLNQSKI